MSPRVKSPVRTLHHPALTHVVKHRGLQLKLIADSELSAFPKDFGNSAAFFAKWPVVFFCQICLVVRGSSLLTAVDSKTHVFTKLPSSFE